MHMPSHLEYMFKVLAFDVEVVMSTTCKIRWDGRHDEIWEFLHNVDFETQLIIAIGFED